MLAILFAAASLLTQACIFRDLEDSHSNTQVNYSDYGCRSGHVRIPADGSPGESDSSRTAELASNR